MTAKKNLRMASLALFLTIATSASSAVIVPESGSVKTEDVRSQQLLQRLEQIKGIDKSELSRFEKKSLRKEVLTIKKEMKAISGGVYLSVGAIIIIILLLILLL